ncbi:DNA-3-methyladenine glycosylase I [Corynebacterium auriscanis]|nr:DNA-3-methyladenine glycosylase I [Corynebacterium auriscanis]WJY71830.1 DNA-3-methyladenine glycosylase 1 [Corynebacterium auriscanis]
MKAGTLMADNVLPNGLIRGDDGIARPPWTYRTEIEKDYFDNEWGRHVITESGLLERITLEGFQSGLSWSLVLNKRPAFRDAFHMFDPTRIVAMPKERREAALADERLIRNPQKHAALYDNAQAAIDLRDDPEAQALPEGHPARKVLGGAADRLAPGLPVLVWSFTPEHHERPRDQDKIPRISDESIAMAKALKDRGFRFVGPTTCYATMQAIGMVNDRVVQPEGDGET